MPVFVGYPDDPMLTSEEGQTAVRRARARLDHGKTYRQANRESKWRQSETQYNGDHWGVNGANAPQDPTADLVVVNISFSTVTTIVPYVTGSDPRFLVEPYSTDATLAKARAQMAWVNRRWRQQDSGCRRSTERAAHNNIVFGDGYGKVAHKTVGTGQAELTEITLSSPSPWDIWIDPMADGIHNARWVCERIRTTLGELKKDPSIRNLDNIDFQLGLDDQENINVRERAYDVIDKDGDDLRWVELYEFWDIVENRLIVFTSGDHNLPIKVVRDVQCPIRSVENHWIPNSPYHMGDLEQIYSMQMELNKSRSQMLTHRRRNIVKHVIRENAFDPESERALTSEVVGAIAKLKTQEPIENVFKTIQIAPLGADAYNVSDIIKRDVEEVTGVNEYLRGTSPQIRKTATEASIIEGASNVKSAHKLGKVENFVRDIATVILAIAADTFPQTAGNEEQMFITGKDAEALNKATQGEELTRIAEEGAGSPMLNDIMAKQTEGADLYGDAAVNLSRMFGGTYQVEVIQNSTELRDPIFKEQKFREMAQQLTAALPALQQAGVQVNLKKAYELWFEAADIQDVDEMFTEAPGGAFPGQPQAPGMPPGGEAPGQLQGMNIPNLAGLGGPNDLIDASNSGIIAPEPPA